MRRFPILSSFILAYFSILSSQNDNIEFIRIEEGLSQTTITSILQDSEGFMWFGTYDGLNRYDGYEFKIYKQDRDNPASISHSLITTIFEDRSGRLWLGTYGGGLNRFNKNKDTFQSYEHDPFNSNSIPDNSVNVIYEDADGILWIGTYKGLSRFDPETEQFINYQHNPEDPTSISGNIIASIKEDKYGIMWIGTFTGGLNQFNKDSGKFINFMPDPDDPFSISYEDIKVIFEDDFGELWFGTWGGGLNRYDRENKGFIHYRHDPKNPYSISDKDILSICESSGGELWIGTWDGGVMKYDREHDQFFNFKHEPLNPTSINSDEHIIVYADRSDILWVGTRTGINKYSSTIHKFNLIKSDPDRTNYSLNDDNINALFIDSDGIIWIGTYLGLNRYDAASGKFKYYRESANNRDSLSYDNVSAIYEDSYNTLWIGTWVGLNKFDKTREHFYRIEKNPSDPHGLSDEGIRCITEDSKNNIWIGTSEGGVNKYDRETGNFTQYNHDPYNPNTISHRRVLAIIEDHFGALWIGTEGGGLNKLEAGQDKFIHYRSTPGNLRSLSDDIVLSLFEDKKETLWIGTQSGLNKYDRETDSFSFYNEDQGLINNAVRGIIDDDHGNLWLSTNKGISRFNPETESFKNYTELNGLQAGQFSIGAVYKSEDGMLYFGGAMGLNYFHPDSIRDAQNIPPVILTNLYILNKRVDINQEANGRIVFDKPLNNLTELVLTYDDYSFSLDYAALSYDAPENIQYSHKLENFDKEWIYRDAKRRYASYTNLPAGDYVLKVKATNSDGVWNEDGLSLRITVTPPFWQTMWFRLLSAVIIAGLFFGFYERRINTIRKQRKELEKRVAERTQQLSAVNKELEAFSYSVSHDLKTPVRSMVGFSQILLDEYSQELNKEGKGYLKRIVNSGKKMTKLIEDLLKISKISRIDLNFVDINLSHLVKEIVDEYKQGIDNRTVYFDIEDDIYIKGDKTLINVLLSNLIGNALKFTQKNQETFIKFGSLVIDGIKTYFISDNGIGIDKETGNSIFEPFQRHHHEYEGSGIGLATVRRIVERHGGKVWADGKVNEGAIFYFTLGN